MGAFDGETYRVSVYRKGDEDPDSVTTDEPRELVDRLRQDPDVRAVETYTAHFVIGAYQDELSFGSVYEEDE
ncbi:hypothetical protein [Streptomyces sp. R44]|uniref:Halobacterial output domain-containing protein n=1 Tax=Streptomyces sp. R44 TaxID=3238633 RepID=A0AB39T1T5_9ACTN